MIVYEARPYPVQVCLLTDAQEAKKILGRKAPKGADGYCAWTDEGIYIYVADDNLATLVHEIVHASLFILEYVGIDPSSNSGECQAYLVDNMFSYFKDEINGGK